MSEIREGGEKAIVGLGDSSKGINSCQNHLSTEEDDVSKSSELVKSPLVSIEKEAFFGSIAGFLLVDSLKSGSSKCIQYEDSLITLNEFQWRGGKQKCCK